MKIGQSRVRTDSTRTPASNSTRPFLQHLLTTRRMLKFARWPPGLFGRTSRSVYLHCSRYFAHGRPKDVEKRPQLLRDKRLFWNEETLLRFAKLSFAGLRSDWKAQQDPEYKKKKEENQRKNRWTSRRKEVCSYQRFVYSSIAHFLVKKAKCRLNAAPTYLEEHGVNPKELISESHMSDDGSGPEDSDEDKVVWKYRMAEQSGMVSLGEAQLQQLKFRENIQSEWRSEGVSSCIV